MRSFLSAAVVATSFASVASANGGLSGIQATRVVAGNERPSALYRAAGVSELRIGRMSSLLRSVRRDMSLSRSDRGTRSRNARLPLASMRISNLRERAASWVHRAETAHAATQGDSAAGLQARRELATAYMFSSEVHALGRQLEARLGRHSQASDDAAFAAAHTLAAHNVLAGGRVDQYTTSNRAAGYWRLAARHSRSANRRRSEAGALRSAVLAANPSPSSAGSTSTALLVRAPNATASTASTARAD